MIEDYARNERLGHVEQMQQALPNAMNNGDRIVAAALLKNGQIDRMLTINADEIGLNGCGVLGFAYYSCRKATSGSTLVA